MPFQEVKARRENSPFKLITSLMMSTCDEESDSVSIQLISNWVSRKPCAALIKIVDRK